MIPELTAAYLSGMVPAAAMAGTIALVQARKAKSKQTQTLQANLALLSYQWSDRQSAIVMLSERQKEKEAKLAARGNSLMFAFGIFASWLGFLILLLLFVSMNYIAVPRVERRLYESDLANKILAPDQVEAILKELGLHLPKVT